MIIIHCRQDLFQKSCRMLFAGLSQQCIETQLLRQAEFDGGCTRKMQLRMQDEAAMRMQDEAKPSNITASEHAIKQCMPSNRHAIKQTQPAKQNGSLGLMRVGLFATSLLNPAKILSSQLTHWELTLKLEKSSF